MAGSLQRGGAGGSECFRQEIAVASLPFSQSTDAVKVHAVEFIRRMRGASQPCLFRCDDGSNYVVKFLNNPQHVRVLANEMLGFRLAGLLDLPVPRSAFVEVVPELVRGTPPQESEPGAREVPCTAGWHFGSRFPDAPGKVLVLDFLPDRLLRRVHNLKALFLGALVFDKWTCNCDGRQVIFYRGADDEGTAYSGFLIDQGFCFNDGDWNFPDSPLRGLYPRRLVYEEVRGLRSFEPFLSKVENLEPEQLERCARDIPEEWCGPDPGQIERLLGKLYDRRRKLRQALVDTKNCSLQPFPNWM